MRRRETARTGWTKLQQFGQRACHVVVRALYYVHRASGPWMRGWWLTWEMTAADNAFVASLDPFDPSTVIGSWDSGVVAELMKGLDRGSITLERMCPRYRRLSEEDRYRKVRGFPQRGDGRPALDLLQSGD